ncbi:unnamed protein product [Ilex paraguariensis]|uniref:non-specific serine/threonine protein kinase n=1 Tax=Ilex paraguariensis TaxID=185542 RepID=A0ABC8U604_9AQUA
MARSCNPKFSLFHGLVFILLFFWLEVCTSRDTIISTQSIKDPEIIVSLGKTFKLGFFSPVNTTNRYVGILDNIPVTIVVWVANRDKPLNDSSGIVMISEGGNLVILNGQKEVIWSSNVSNLVANSSVQLLDTGNLVLRDNSSGRIIWENFQQPSDSFLQKMRLGTDAKKGERTLLTSWKSPSDPFIRSFSARIDPLSIPQFVVWNGSHPYWRSGPWNGQVFIGIPTMHKLYDNEFNLVDDKKRTVDLTFSYANESIVLYLQLNSEGSLQKKGRFVGKEDWYVLWWAPKNECDVYGKCGPFGSCNSRDSPICTCLRGFEPKHMDEWSQGNWSSGCKRKTPLQCERNNTVNEKGKGDGFLKLERVKVPDFEVWVPGLEDNCGSLCLNNCSCTAYSGYFGIGCMQWSGSLIDIQKFMDGGADLYIRVAYSELDKEKNIKTVLAITISIGSITIAICAYCFWRWMAKHKASGRKQKSKQLLFRRVELYPEYSTETVLVENTHQTNLEELPLYSLEDLTNATDNFHSTNKLEQGGFGPVYMVDVSVFLPLAPNGFLSHTSTTVRATAVFFAYVGFDAVANSAEESARPQWNFQLCLMGSLLVYILYTVPSKKFGIDLKYVSVLIGIGSVTGLTTTLLVGSSLFVAVAVVVVGTTSTKEEATSTKEEE